MELKRRSRTSWRGLRSPRQRNGQAGFSLIEAIVAAAIILVIAIGLIPLFLRAMVNNTAGGDSTFVGTAGLSQVETDFGLFFNDPTMTIPVGATSTVPVVETFYQGDPTQMGAVTQGWAPSGATGGTGLQLWTRTTTVQQFNVTQDLADDGILNTPEDGSALPGLVHVKQIQVVITSGRTSGLLTGKTITLRMLKAQ
jgi:hypothetical protein